MDPRFSFFTVHTIIFSQISKAPFIVQGGSIIILAACSKPEYFKAVILSAPAIILDPAVQPGALKVSGQTYRQRNRQNQN